MTMYEDHQKNPRLHKVCYAQARVSDLPGPPALNALKVEINKKLNKEIKNHLPANAKHSWIKEGNQNGK